ncbi:hypothetical protein AYO40_04285 [Planctomycetaceae bacterium SCGC AG-212-D15]|nr:hypothetical protein AYO40_04285 [Planctomycetaceae bacterium SCGC AG-212-D15]
MAKRLGPLDTECDAPPYAVVHACQAIGLVTPEDVRWCRLTMRGAPEAPRRWSLRALWQALVGRHPKLCLCRRHLPPVMRNTFEFNTGNELTYLMAQCPRCHTIYWDEVLEARRLC